MINLTDYCRKRRTILPIDKSFLSGHLLVSVIMLMLVQEFLSFFSHSSVCGETVVTFRSLVVKSQRKKEQVRLTIFSA